MLKSQNFRQKLGVLPKKLNILTGGGGAKYTNRGVRWQDLCERKLSLASGFLSLASRSFRRTLAAYISIAMLCCTTLMNETYATNNTVEISKDGTKIVYLLNKDAKTARLHSCTKSIPTLKLLPIFFYNNMYTVTEIGKEAFYNDNTLEIISIPPSIDVLDRAFMICPNLKEAILSPTVNINNAFYNCKALYKINLECTSIDTPLVGYSGIKEIAVGTAVTSICDKAFSQCYDLTTAQLPNSLKSFGNFAFENCSKLTSVFIQPNVQLGTGVFKGCSSLTDISLAAGSNYYERIDDVLYDLSGHKLICYPAGKADTIFIVGQDVNSIADYALYGCANLKEIRVDSNNNYYCAENGVLYNKAKTELICCPAGKTDTSFTVPASVTKIHEHAFATCANLETLTILNPNIKIGDNAFNGTSIKNLYVPSKATLKKFGYDESKNEYTGNSGLKPVPLDDGRYKFEVVAAT